MLTHSAWISFTGGVLLALHGVQHASDTPVLDILYVAVLTGAVCGFVVMPLQASVMKRWMACGVACLSVSVPFILREVMR